MKIYLIPLHHIKPFLQYLDHAGHDIDIIENETLEAEWENYCELMKMASTG